MRVLIFLVVGLHLMRTRAYYCVVNKNYIVEWRDGFGGALSSLVRRTYILPIRVFSMLCDCCSTYSRTTYSIWKLWAMTWLQNSSCLYFSSRFYLSRRQCWVRIYWSFVRTLWFGLSLARSLAFSLRYRLVKRDYLGGVDNDIFVILGMDNDTICQGEGYSKLWIMTVFWTHPISWTHIRYVVRELGGGMIFA